MSRDEERGNFTSDAAVAQVPTPDQPTVEQSLAVQYEQAMRASEARKAAILQTALDAIITMDAEGKILEFNPAAEQMFGYSREQVLGQEMASLIIPPSLRVQHSQGLARYLATGEGTLIGRRMEMIAMRSDGSEFPVELAITRIPLDGPALFTGYIRDITARRAVEEERAQLLQCEQHTRNQAEVANKRLEALLAITDTALTYLALDDLLRELLRRVRDLMSVDNTAILLINEDGGYLTIRAVLGPEEKVASEVRVPIGQGFAGTIAANAQPLVLEDPSSINIVTPLLREQLHALLGVPLVVAGRVIGVIHVGTIDSRKFSDDDVQLLQRVADRTALAIDRASIYEAEQRARAEATVHASELETIIEAMADGVFIYDSKAHLIQANRTARELFALDLQPNYATLPVHERVSQTLIRDEHGQLIPPEQWPMLRILRGEVFKGTDTIDVFIRALDGRDVQLSISGAPVRDAVGEIVGGVLILRDVTERRRLERHTHDTLNALLEMAESLVLVKDETRDEQTHNQDSTEEQRQGEHTRNEVAQRLAELTCSFLGCKRVSISAIDPETEIPHPIAVVGLSPEQEQQWWAEQEQQQVSLRDSSTPELVVRLRANEVLTFDMMQPPFREQPNPYNIHTLLIAPMSIGSQLVGLLSLDHAGVDHEYTPEEVALAKAVARLGALVIERQRLLQERAEARANELALRESNRRMDTFLSMASHELRTPLTTIKGNVQLAQRQLQRLTSGKSSLRKKTLNDGWEETPVSPRNPQQLIPLEKVEAIEGLLGRAEHQIQFLNRLVSDLLDVSRIQADTLELHRKHCDLVTLVRETVEDQQQLFPNRTIHFALPPDVSIPVIADPDCIGQVLTNYISNALKYSAATQPIEIRLEVEGDISCVSVRDHGLGIPPAEQAHIWERFYRAPGLEVQSGSRVGLGLGLHISRTIIDRHGGQVGVQSAPGEGSIFWFTLLLAQPLP